MQYRLKLAATPSPSRRISPSQCLHNTFQPPRYTASRIQRNLRIAQRIGQGVSRARKPAAKLPQTPPRICCEPAAKPSADETQNGTKPREAAKKSKATPIKAFQIPLVPPATPRAVSNATYGQHNESGKACPARKAAAKLPQTPPQIYCEPAANPSADKTLNRIKPAEKPRKKAKLRRLKLFKYLSSPPRYTASRI